ncbi:MAG: TIGR02099 family protein [Xanthomonadales bacterium]|nr:TIGR02099 family protein [Xanthomonadales bacterium]
MMRRLRRLQRALLGALIALVILAGVLVALLSQLLPSLQAHPDAVAGWLQQRIGQPVSLQSVHGAWNGRGVLLELGGLRMGDVDGPSVDLARLQIDVMTGWMPGRPLTSLKLTAPELDLERDAEGHWRVRGLGIGRREETPAQLELVDRLGELLLDRAQVQVHDALHDVEWSLPRVDARVRTQGGRVRVGALAYQDDPQPINIQFDLAADMASGRMHVEVVDAPLRDWLPDGTMQGDARASVRAWVDVAAGRIESGTAEIRLEGRPTLPGSDGPAVGPPSSPATLPPLMLSAGLARDGDDVVLTVSDPEHGDWWQARRSEQDWSLQAAGMSLARWLPWAAELASVWDEERSSEWPARIRALEPAGTLRGLRMTGGEDGLASLSASVEQLGMAAVGKHPGVSGLNLVVHGDADRVLWETDSPDFAFDWPVSLRQTMRPRAHGHGVAWRDPEQGLCAAALDLALDDPAYHIRAEGGVCRGDSGLTADLRVDVGPTDITHAKQFWITNRMPERTVQWLDDALVSGRLASGALLLHGELGHWPFRDGAGRMQARADVADVELAYHRDWPRGEHLTGTAWFVNSSMEVELSADVGGVRAEHVRGGISDFKDAVLALQLSTRERGAALLQFLRDSPLWSKLESGMAQIGIVGQGDVDLAFELSLKHGAPPPEVHGTVTFPRADLRHAGWGIAFDAAQGVVQFSNRGVRIEDMKILQTGRSASFDLNVGSFVVDPSRQVESSLVGRLDLRALIDTQPELTWLRPWIEGEAEFTIDLQIPEDKVQPPHLRLRSDLVGVSLTLPAPLRKSAATPMPMDLELDLLSGGQIVSLRLGELLQLVGETGTEPAFTGVAAFGGAEVDERPERGIAVLGQVPVLDVDGWLGLALHNSGEGLIDSVDLHSGDLAVLGRSFSETALRWARQAGQQRVRLEGEHIAGEIEIPGDEQFAQRGITARFQRLHWGTAERETASSASIDPRSVPPLHLHIEQFRLGEAELGDTRLETFPDLDGMRVQQFDARSEALQLSARGRWSGSGDAERSQFTAEFAAENLGAMLSALGFADLVEGGQSLVSLDASWPGAPSGFSLQRSTGTLKLSVGEGQIPNVKPGAGRLLGLLSLGQIPRRLALDFSDFFGQGLAFDKIEGNFRLAAGTATTDGLLIDSPAAEIRIRGTTGLADQSYDQTMEVLPRAGNVLPVVGALAAGPAGAALGAVAQAVLQKPFKQMTRTLYSVQGSWDEPTIEVVERGPAREGSARRGVEEPVVDSEDDAEDGGIERAEAEARDEEE